MTRFKLLFLFIFVILLIFVYSSYKGKPNASTLDAQDRFKTDENNRTVQLEDIKQPSLPADKSGSEIQLEDDDDEKQLSHELPEFLRYIIIGLYFFIIVILCIYGFHRLVLVTLFHKYINKKLEKPELPADENLPIVTIQLPLFNERTVAERVIFSMRDVDYPRDRFEVQVLDDSIDDTKELCAELVEQLKSEGFDAVHLHRTDRTGYKAGALEEGMKVAKGELLAIFDADFIPPATFLKDLVPYFQDEKIGVVQSRWGHINREFSQLTRTQAVMLDAHFVVEHFARNRSGR